MKKYFAPKDYILTAGYSIDLSQIEYDDFIANDNVLVFGKRQTDFMVVSPNINPHEDSMFSKTELRKLHKTDLDELYYNLINSSYYYEPNKKEKIEWLSEVTVADYYQWLYENGRWYDLPCDFISRGYSQGDAVKVLYHKSKPDNQKIIDNILWDAPAKLHLENTITGEEYYLDEYLDSAYNYDKDALLENVKDVLPQCAYDFLKEYLPEALEYN